MNQDHIHRLDLNLLTIFDAVMSEQSLTKAGRRLGITQSAVSHAVSRLRDITGDPLFERTGRGVRPTVRARELATDVSAALDTLRAALRKPEGGFSTETSERTFLLDIPAGIDCIVMPPLVKATLGSRNLNFRISGARARDIMKDLRYGDTWLALDYEVATDPAYRSQLLFEDPFAVVSKRNHPALVDGLTLELFQVLEHAAFGWAGEHQATPVGQRLESMGIRRKVRYSVPNIATLPPIVESFDVVAVMPLKIARNFQHRFKIDIHELPGTIPPLPVYMVWHESFEDDEGHTWLRQALKDVCERL